MYKMMDAINKCSMFGDDDINFNLDLDKFGMHVAVLWGQSFTHIFCGLLEDWEKPHLLKNDSVI